MDQTLPRAAQRILDAATAAGWMTRVVWQADSDDLPFVTLELGRALPMYVATLTWHSRPTSGKSLRLFSALWRWAPASHTDDDQVGHGWADVSLKRLEEVIAALPVAEQDPYVVRRADELEPGTMLWDWRGRHGTFTGMEQWTDSRGNTLDFWWLNWTGPDGTPRRTQLSYPRDLVKVVSP